RATISAPGKGGRYSSGATGRLDVSRKAADRDSSSSYCSLRRCASILSSACSTAKRRCSLTARAALRSSSRALLSLSDKPPVRSATSLGGAAAPSIKPRAYSRRHSSIAPSSSSAITCSSSSARLSAPRRACTSSQADASPETSPSLVIASFTPYRRSSSAGLLVEEYNHFTGFATGSVGHAHNALRCPFTGSGPYVVCSADPARGGTRPAYRSRRADCDACTLWSRARLNSLTSTSLHASA